MDTGVSEAFTSRFGAAPTHVVRAPGRVNLIGEHIDYHHLPVLPMAIDREIRLFFRRREDGVVRAVTWEEGMADASFELGRDVPHARPGDWSNYLRAAARALARGHGAEVGVDLLADSTLPVAAGLSSSSALVVGTGLALARANDLQVDRVAFAEQMADAERYTGTHGGGMDQAVCLLAQAGHALYLEFQPVAARPISLPPDLRFIVAHSLEGAEKSGRAQAAYNERRKTGEAARVSVASALGLPSQTGFGGLIEVGEEVLRAASDVLSGVTSRYFRHVVTEARRVGEAVAAIESSDMTRLGVILDESHESLRSDYRVSTPALDRLVTIAREAGALGARLTGAGFGGSMIALVDAEEGPSLRGAIARDFYHPRGIADPETAGHLLEVRASEGASVHALA